MLHHWVPLVWHYNKINWKIIMYSVLQKYYKIKILLDTYLYLELSKHYFFFMNLEGESGSWFQSLFPKNLTKLLFETNPSFQPNLSSISVLLRTRFFGRGPWSQNVSIWPLPFISTMPRVSKLKSCGSKTFLTSDVTWIRFGDPEDSILEATLTVFPQISNWGLRAPMTPATTGPTFRPIRSF